MSELPALLALYFVFCAALAQASCPASRPASRPALRPALRSASRPALRLRSPALALSWLFAARLFACAPPSDLSPTCALALWQHFLWRQFASVARGGDEFLLLTAGGWPAARAHGRGARRVQGIRFHDHARRRADSLRDPTGFRAAGDHASPRHRPLVRLQLSRLRAQRPPLYFAHRPAHTLVPGAPSPSSSATPVDMRPSKWVSRHTPVDTRPSSCDGMHFFPLQCA